MTYTGVRECDFCVLVCVSSTELRCCVAADSLRLRLRLDLRVECRAPALQTGGSSADPVVLTAVLVATCKSTVQRYSCVVGSYGYEYQSIRIASTARYSCTLYLAISRSTRCLVVHVLMYGRICILLTRIAYSSMHVEGTPVLVGSC